MTTKRCICRGVCGPIFLLLFFIGTSCSRKQQQNEEDVRRFFSDINAQLFGNKGKLLKELSFKIENNHINDNRYIYGSTVPPNMLTPGAFRNILNRTGMAGPYLHHFPTTDISNIKEIGLGADGETKKLYVSEKGRIMAIQCNNGECKQKLYKLSIHLNQSLLESLHPQGTEIYENFPSSPAWEIKKESGEMALHVMLDPLQGNLFPLSRSQTLFQKWTQHLLSKKIWDSWISTRRDECVYLMGLSKRSVTFYVRGNHDEQNRRVHELL